WTANGGIDVKLGLPVYGFGVERVRTVAEAVAWLRDQALTYYPDSEFTRKNQNAVADDARGGHAEDEARAGGTPTMRRAMLAENEARAMRAEDEKLRETVMQLVVDNHALREQAARSLAHRALEGVKQSGQALLAIAIAFAKIAFVRRQFAARHRDSKSRTQRVVVHGLAAAWIALTMGIVAILSLQHVAMLGGSSVRSGTMALSGQETTEAAERSDGLPAEAERRGSISGQPSSAAIESIAEQRPSNAEL